MYILGLSGLYHDSAAVLLKDGVIIAASQEERFTRKKHDEAFPIKSIEYCLNEAGIKLSSIDIVSFYEKPFLKFERLLETFITQAPFKGLKLYLKSLPSWLEYKLNIKSYLRKQFKLIEDDGLSEKTQLKFSYHHLSHAASSYFASPYQKAALLCVDGVGEWESLTTWTAENNNIKPLYKINFPHSLGLLYSAFTYYCGFKVNSGEYKLMGLAPYGEPKYKKLIFDHLIDVKSDGSFHMDMSYFSYPHKDTMITKKFEDLFSKKARVPESELSSFYKDVAASIQKVLEEILVKIAQNLYQKTQNENLCLAGGVALNCVANSVLLKNTSFKNIWVQPAAGDAGGALGAALAVWHMHLGHKKEIIDQMQGCYLGPSFKSSSIESSLTQLGAQFSKLDEAKIYERTAQSIAEGKIVGWFSGRMEYGPRSLGGRSILADARSTDMQKNLNLKIKFRESFRPFAPITLATDNNFDFADKSPYMLFTSPVNTVELPAVTHVDKSARLQTLSKSNGRIYKLLLKFKELTDCDTMINTSFNVRGEPIVCNPAEAFSCFMSTHMDVLVIEDYYLVKTEQKQNVTLPSQDFVLD